MLRNEKRVLTMISAERHERRFWGIITVLTILFATGAIIMAILFRPILYALLSIPMPTAQIVIHSTPSPSPTPTEFGALGRRSTPTATPTVTPPPTVIRVPTVIPTPVTFAICPTNPPFPGIVLTHNLNLRTGPDMRFPLVQKDGHGVQLNPGTVFAAIARDNSPGDEPWIFISVNSLTGWVKANRDYVAICGNVRTLPDP